MKTISRNKKETPIEELKIVPVKEGDDVISDSNKAINSLMDLMKSDSEREKLMRAKNVDGQFFFAIYFQTKEQKDLALKLLKLDDLTTGQYIRGIDFAERLGVKIDKLDIKPPCKFKGFKRVNNLLTSHK